MVTFKDVVELIKSIFTDEKEEIKLLLQQYIREERRDEIYANFKSAQIEEKQEELKFSSNLKELKNLIDE